MRLLRASALVPCMLPGAACIRSMSAACAWSMLHCPARACCLSPLPRRALGVVGLVVGRIYNAACHGSWYAVATRVPAYNTTAASCTAAGPAPRRPHLRRAPASGKMPVCLQTPWTQICWVTDFDAHTRSWGYYERCERQSRAILRDGTSSWVCESKTRCIVRRLQLWKRWVELGCRQRRHNCLILVSRMAARVLEGTDGGPAKAVVALSLLEQPLPGGCSCLKPHPVWQHANGDRRVDFLHERVAFAGGRIPASLLLSHPVMHRLPKGGTRRARQRKREGETRVQWAQPGKGFGHES